jgi:hypothetical protein
MIACLQATLAAKQTFSGWQKFLGRSVRQAARFPALKTHGARILQR